MSSSSLSIVSLKNFNLPDPRLTFSSYQKWPNMAHPTARGFFLVFSTWLAEYVPFVSWKLYRDGGFHKLPHLKAIAYREARNDPTVIPIAEPRKTLFESMSPGYYTAIEQVPHSSNLSNSGSDPSIDSDSKPDDNRVTYQSNLSPSNTPYRSVTDYHRAYLSGRITPSDVVESLLPLIRRDVPTRSPHSVAFLQIRCDLVKHAAAQSTLRYKSGKQIGILDGVPIAIKDEVDLTGYSKCYGTKIDYTDPRDHTSWCVQKFLDEGAVVIGKTNMHEIGLDTTNNNPNWGTPLNPFNDRFYTGGSSGGSAYSVGAGLVPIAIGTDGGGSIRIPAAYCGVLGLKTSHGRVSSYPTVPLSKTTGAIGPIAGNMFDLDIAYRVMAIPDPAHESSRMFSPPQLSASMRTQTQKKVLGVYRRWFDRADGLVRKTCFEMIDRIQADCGYQVVDINIPFLVEGQLSHILTIMSEVGSGMLVANSNAGTKQLSTANRLMVAVTKHASAQHYVAAQRVRNVIMQHMSGLFQTHPGLIVVSPTSALAGSAIDFPELDLSTHGVSDSTRTARSMSFVWLANFTGLPSLTVPCGYVPPRYGNTRIPVGLIGTSMWGTEDSLIQWGIDVETVLGRSREHPQQKWVDVLGQLGYDKHREG